MTSSIKGLERFDSPGKGRGLRVTRAFKVGELLFSCPAYTSVLAVEERGNLCEFCLNSKQGLARCGKCKKAFYCNAKCQKGDWSMHKLECSSMIAFGEKWCPSEISRLVARILAKKKSQKEKCSSENMMQVQEMQSHLKDMDNEKREMSESDIAQLHRFYSKHLDFPDHQELLSLFSQVACNGFTIEDEELFHLGTAVYPDVALINHSCLPNTIITFHGTAAEIRAVTDMKPGDEVFISYIDLIYPTDDRNNRLRESYYFTCECPECQSRSLDRVKLKVRKFSDPIEEEVINNMERYARKAIKEFRASKDNRTPSELLDICELSLEKMGSVFEDSNVYMLHMMYQAMGVCLYMENIEEAILYGEKLIKPYSQLYSPLSLNLSSIYLKLGRLYMTMDRHKAGLNMLKKAEAIMEVTHGKDHVYLAELHKKMAQK
ncbi:N-lysine methyltransferase SMYD2-like [Eucyclogobius newberryi]|uniref:N-lysine methyltransferase SMYD2-like n=1 Tax=Eucyclogobius newberryi TaxID=166745 RepID=UPI003B5A7CC2